MTAFSKNANYDASARASLIFPFVSDPFTRYARVGRPLRLTRVNCKNDRGGGARSENRQKSRSSIFPDFSNLFCTPSRLSPAPPLPSDRPTKSADKYIRKRTRRRDNATRRSRLEADEKYSVAMRNQCTIVHTRVWGGREGRGMGLTTLPECKFLLAESQRKGWGGAGVNFAERF